MAKAQQAESRACSQNARSSQVRPGEPREPEAKPQTNEPAKEGSRFATACSPV